MERLRRLAHFQTHCHAIPKTEGAELQEQKWAASVVAKIVATDFAVGLIAAYRARSMGKRMHIGCQNWHSGAFEGSSKELGYGTVGSPRKMKSVG